MLMLTLSQCERNILKIFIHFRENDFTGCKRIANGVLLLSLTVFLFLDWVYICTGRTCSEFSVSEFPGSTLVSIQ